MKNKTKDVEEIKKEIVFDFIRYKATKNDSFKNSVLNNLKELCKYYRVNLYSKVSKMEDFEALNLFLEFDKNKKYLIDLIYSNL